MAPGTWKTGSGCSVDPLSDQSDMVISKTKWWFNGGLMGFNQQNGGFNGIYPLVN